MPKRLRKRASKATAIPLHNATQLIKKPVVRRKTKKERRKEKSLKFKQRIAKDIQKEKNVEDQTKISVASLVHSLKEADLRNQHEEQKEQQKKAQNNGRLRAKWQQEEINQFKQVVDHPAFQSHPMATLKEHLANKIALENARKDAAVPVRRKW